uniref:Laminin N-terminal domain-containing protein n=1 Tax=Heterorhabditis bacteriophora TaxID=37862 RepID=A0A1I7XEC8_HETBA
MREPDHDPCYEPTGRPVRCVPEFINAAFGKPVIATDTCGLNGATNIKKLATDFVLYLIKTFIRMCNKYKGFSAGESLTYKI